MRNYTLALAKEDYKFGIHSLIPKCCVKNYIELQLDGVEYPGTYMMELYPQLKGNLKLQYVPCYNCANLIIIGAIEPVETHKCDHVFGTKECYDILAPYYAQIQKWKLVNA